MASDKKPERPMNAYHFFLESCREEVKKQFPEKNIPMIQFSKQCAERWKTLTDKKRFQEMAAVDKRRFEREMKSYNPPEGTKRKVRKPKDPNAPKRPLTAFFIFSQEQRALVKQRNPDLPITEVAKELGRLWTQSDADTKAKYHSIADQQRKRYALEVANYNSRLEEAAAAAADSDDADEDED